MAAAIICFDVLFVRKKDEVRLTKRLSGLPAKLCWCGLAAGSAVAPYVAWVLYLSLIHISGFCCTASQNRSMLSFMDAPPKARFDQARPETSRTRSISKWAMRESPRMMAFCGASTKRFTRVTTLLPVSYTHLQIDIFRCEWVRGAHFMEVTKAAWDFFQNEILGMGWLNRLIAAMLDACGLENAGRIGGSVQFFIYDTIKIMILLGVLILIISYIQSYFPPERTKKILGRFHGIGANVIAALLGTVTPFCSCSSIPLFIGFTSAGLPLGVTFSFLISSPMVDLGSLVLLMSIFGWKVAVLYVILGLVIAVVGGTQMCIRDSCNKVRQPKRCDECTNILY